MWFFGTHPDPYSLPNNAALKFDLLVFPKENLWKGFGQSFDPEGLLSTLPAIVNVIAGYLCGRFIQKNPKKIKLVVSLLCMGVILLGIGKFWNIFFPINKGIWTSSFVVYSTGWDLLLIALLIFITEIAKISRWTYFFPGFRKEPAFHFYHVWRAHQIAQFHTDQWRKPEGDHLSRSLPKLAGSIQCIFIICLIFHAVAVVAWICARQK